MQRVKLGSKSNLGHIVPVTVCLPAAQDVVCVARAAFNIK